MKISCPSPKVLVAVISMAAIAAVMVYHRADLLKSAAADLNENMLDEERQEFLPIDSPTVQQERLVKRIYAKEDIARSLIFGQMTFADAASRFRELSRGDPTTLSRLRARFPAAMEDELWYRQVMGYMNGYVRTYPEQVAALLPKLDAEVTRRFPARVGVGVPVQQESMRMGLPFPQNREAIAVPAGGINVQVVQPRR
jgi:hypothetical protein